MLPLTILISFNAAAFCMMMCYSGCQLVLLFCWSVSYFDILVVQITADKSPCCPKKSATSCLVLSGIMFFFSLSWISAYLTITIPEIDLLAQVLFTIFSSLQGFGIFVHLFILNHEAYKSYKELLRCGSYTFKFLHPSKFISTTLR